jgi:MFS family permease
MPIHLVIALCLLNGVGLQASRVVLPLYALDLDASPLMVGVLGATFAGLPLLLSVPIGRLSDRFGARWLLIFGALIGALGMFLPYFLPGLAAAFIASALTGLTFGVFSVSLQNLVGLLSTADNRAQYFSNHSLAASGGNFIGPLIAGYSVEQFGHVPACVHVAWLLLVPIAMIAVWGGALPGGVRKDENSARAGGSLLAEPGVKKTIIASGLLLAAQDLFRIYMPVYGHSISLSPSTIGIVLAAFPAASFFVRVILQWLVNRLKEERLLVASFYVSAACLMLLPLFEDAIILSAIAFVFGLGMGCSQPIITMLMFANSPTGRSGEALGLRMTAVHFTRLVGPVIFGAVGSALGLLPMFYVNALMMGAGGYLSRPTKR